MNAKRIAALVLPLLILLLLLTVSLVAARDGQPGDGRQPLSPDAPEAQSSYIPVQGRLTDADGTQLDGVYSIVFRLYGQYSGGAPL